MKSKVDKFVTNPPILTKHKTGLNFKLHIMFFLNPKKIYNYDLVNTICRFISSNKKGHNLRNNNFSTIKTLTHVIKKELNSPY